MIRIVSDTSTLYSTVQAKEAGFRVLRFLSPLPERPTGSLTR